MLCSAIVCGDFRHNDEMPIGDSILESMIAVCLQIHCCAVGKFVTL